MIVKAKCAKKNLKLRIELDQLFKEQKKEDLVVFHDDVVS